MKILNFDKRIVNVTLLFITAYAIIHLVYLFLVLACATYIDILDVKYYFSYVSYDISSFVGWTRMKIIILYGLPTFSMLILAGIFFIAMKGFSFADAARQKLFFLWLILISLSFFISSFISSPFFRHSVSIVAEWFYMSREIVFGLSLFFWASIPLIAFLSSGSFIKLANSRSFLRTKWTRLVFLINNVLLPFLIGTIIFSVLIILAPGYSIEYYFEYDFMRFFALSLILLFVFVFNFHKRYVGIKRTRDLEQLSIPFLIFTIVTLTTIYVGLYFT